LEANADPTLAVAAVCSTALYVFAAIALAAQIFGTDAILYGSQATWSDIVRRPSTVQQAASVPAVTFCLAVMFPCYFVLSGTLARSTDVAMDRRLILGGLITVLVFGVIPWFVAAFTRVRLADLRRNSAGAIAFLAAALLGVSLWPAAHEIFLLNEWLGLPALQAEHLASVKNLLDEWRAVSPGLILVMLALVPGVCEEFFFRGVFFKSMAGVLSPGRTVIASALVFGLFHVVAAGQLTPERFLPSTFLGLVLGWVRLRTDSVLPCMVLHALHNGLLLSVVYWRDELAARGFGIEDSAHLPASWLVSALVCAAVAATMLVAATKAPRPTTLAR